MTEQLPELRYVDLIDEALARIPALAPEWTDHNPSDPGIALLELTAWLVETVLYRSGRITDDGRQALLGLLRGQDPDAAVRGTALEEALRDAIKSLRTPYRTITPQDYADRLRDAWPTSTAALALGIGGKLGGVTVFANRNLEGADPYADDEVHLSVVVTPSSLRWCYRGMLDPARPSLFFRQHLATPLGLSLPGGAESVQITGPTALLYDGPALVGGTIALTPTDAQLGDDGEFRVEVEAAALSNGMTLTAADVSDRRLTAPDATLLGQRWISVRRAGWLQVVVATESTTPLRLELRYYNNQIARTVEGAGVVCLAHSIGQGSVYSPPREWQLRVFALDDTDAIDVAWHVMHHQEPLSYANGGDALLDAVWDFLEPRRLLTVRHHVTAPRWVFLDVQATIYLEDGTDTETALPRLYDALYAAFPMPGRGRELGQTVYHTEVIAAIEGVEGVDYVEDLVIGLDGKADRGLTEAGEPYGLVLAADEAVVPRCDLIAFTLYERS